MSYVVLVLLSLLWLGFFLPGLLQARRSSPFVSASDFQQSLTRISNGVAVDASSTPPPAVASRRRSRREIARRRDTLLCLVASVIAGVALGLSFGGILRWLALPPAVALVTYVAMLRADATRRRRRVTPAMRVAAPPVTGSPGPRAPGEDGVVPSVGRRTPAPAATAESAELERIAG